METIRFLSCALPSGVMCAIFSVQQRKPQLHVHLRKGVDYPSRRANSELLKLNDESRDELKHIHEVLSLRSGPDV